MITTRRTYVMLRTLPTFEERFDYLCLSGQVGESTFGFEREVNQSFYHSREWRRVREHVIARDGGYDLGCPDFPIPAAPHIHHMNPLTLDELEHADDNLFDLQGLITVSQRTHNAIHYGTRANLPQRHIERVAGDTRRW